METAVRAPSRGPGPRGRAPRSTPGRRRRRRCCGSIGPVDEHRRRRRRRRSASDVGAARATHGPAACAALEQLDALRGLITGYDVSGRGAHRCVADYGRLRDELAPRRRPSCVRRSSRLLTTFADLCELSRNRPTGEEEDDRRTGPQPARALPCLPALPRRRAGAPAGCVPEPGCRGALATTASTDLDPGPELEEAVYRIFLAQERAPTRSRWSRPAGALARRRRPVAGPAAGRDRGSARSADRRHAAAVPRSSATSPGASASGCSTSR